MSAVGHPLWDILPTQRERLERQYALSHLGPRHSLHHRVRFPIARIIGPDRTPAQALYEARTGLGPAARSYSAQGPRLETSGRS
jgi:hypothetical protein